MLAALRAGKVVATANKETLVAGGHLVMAEAARAGRGAGRRRSRATRSPRRSPGCGPSTPSTPRSGSASSVNQRPAIARLVLTASGGPFLDATPDELAGVTPEQALKHPTWTMGAKITIDSATLANKGLEVIEAHWLYDVEYDAIDVVVHPQSVVHSAVLFVDGSLKAQLGTPDMRLPIQYALTHPERLPSPTTPPDLVAAARLDFRAPDETRFPALRIAREAGPHRLARLGRADRRGRGRGRPLPRRHARLPGHPAPARGRRHPLRRGRRPGARRRRPRSARPRGPRGLRDRHRGGHRMTGLIQSLITIVVFILHARRARPRPRGRALHHGALGEGPRARVRHRLPAPRQDRSAVASGPPTTRAARRDPIPALPPGVEPGSDEAEAFLAAARAQDAEAGATLYTLNWLPIGGFVKLEGEDGSDDADPHSFANAKLWVKVGILLAGVTMNLLLAFAIFTGIALVGEPGASVEFDEVAPGIAGRGRRACAPATRSTP